MRVLFDKCVNKKVDKDFWVDNYGDVWVNSDPFGANMNGSTSIMKINGAQFELRELCGGCQEELDRSFNGVCPKCSDDFPF